MRRVVLAIKRPHRSALALALADMLIAERGDKLRAQQPDLVIPIPMHWRRRLSQRVNNPELLAEVLARELSVELATHALVRTRLTRPQGELSPHRRRHNVRGALRLARGCHLQGARVLLVDDVLTTGGTCQAAAKALKTGGAAKVFVAVLARATGHNF